MKLTTACAPEPKRHWHVPLNRTHCAPKRNKTPCQPSGTCEPQALLAEIETNRTCSAPKSRRTERAERRHHDETHYPPLRGPGHKKRYLSKLSSLHLHFRASAVLSTGQRVSLIGAHLFDSSQGRLRMRSWEGMGVHAYPGENVFVARTWVIKSFGQNCS